MMAIERAREIPHPQEPKPRRLNCFQAAKLADRSVWTIRREIKRKRLKGFKIGGNVFILWSDFIEWLGYNPMDVN